MQSNVCYAFGKGCHFSCFFNLDCIDVQFGRFDTSHSTDMGTGKLFSFFKRNLGLLQYCILIIYVMKSLLFPCAYMVLCTIPIYCLQTTSRSDLQVPLQPYTGSVYLYKCKKMIIIMKEVFFCLFLMDIAVGGGLRLI